MDLEDIWENANNRGLTWEVFEPNADKWRRHTKEDNQHFNCCNNAFVDFLRAQVEANIVVQETVDALCRPSKTSMFGAKFLSRQ